MRIVRFMALYINSIGYSYYHYSIRLLAYMHNVTTGLYHAKVAIKYYDYQILSVIIEVMSHEGSCDKILRCNTLREREKD